MALTVDEENFVKALYAGTATGLTLAGQLRINNPSNATQSALFIDNPAAVTAAQIVNGANSNNPCLKLAQPAASNAACLEMDQGDEEDAAVALDSDIRAEQFIAVGASPHFAMAPGGALQGSLADDTAASPEYYDILKWDGKNAKLVDTDGNELLRWGKDGVFVKRGDTWRRI